MAASLERLVRATFSSSIEIGLKILPTGWPAYLVGVSILMIMRSANSPP